MSVKVSNIVSNEQCKVLAKIDGDEDEMNALLEQCGRSDLIGKVTHIFVVNNALYIPKSVDVRLSTEVERVGWLL